MATDSSFQRYNHGHNDLVLAVDYNFYGTRMVTASSDHHLKVWDRQKDDEWVVTANWPAHDAEISDVSSLMYLLIFPMATPRGSDLMVL